MKSLKIVLPATLLALLPLGAQAGIAPFKFLTATAAQAAEAVEPVQFVLRKGKGK
ncbi:MAG: hypothetical protein IE927_07780 [Rhodobacterales bacterium]|nr:hypothetical protein [Rhodobacterales bacterium]